jgi:hypothetical protein
MCRRVQFRFYLEFGGRGGRGSSCREGKDVKDITRHYSSLGQILRTGHLLILGPDTVAPLLVLGFSILVNNSADEK